jgi:type II secretory pathway component GspD/PulD (secretin)
MKMRTTFALIALISTALVVSSLCYGSTVRITSIEVSNSDEGLMVKLKGTGEMEFHLKPSYYEGDKLVVYGDIVNSYCYVNKRKVWKTLNPPDDRVERILLAQHTFDPPVTRLAFLLREEIYPEVKRDGNSLILLLPSQRPEPPPETSTMDRIVTIRSEGETLGRILMLLFEQYGANFIVEEGVDVNREITLNLRDVPLKVALRELLGSLGYRFQEIEGGIIKVMARKEEEKTEKAESPGQSEMKPKPPRLTFKAFRLKHAPVRGTIQLLSEVIPAEIKITGDDVSRTVILTGDEGRIAELTPMIEGLLKEIDVPSPEPQGAVEKKPEPVKKVLKVNYSDPEELKRILAPLLSPQGSLEAYAGGREQGGRGSDYEVVGSGGASGGYLIISDLPEVISEVERELRELDRPTPQVEIRAYIIERMISDESQIGLDWSFGYKGKELLVQGGSSGDSGSRGFLNLKYGTLSPTDFKAVLRAISSGSNARVLSNPRITVLEGQQARFHSGDQVGFSKVTIQEGIETVETEFKDLGVVLTVSAQVKEGSAVMLDVSVQVSDLGEMTKTGEPTISTREAQTRVLVHDGDTLVIGGLTSERKIHSVEKLPLLGDIPLLGRIFSNHKTVSKKTEVMVFMTPRIIQPPPGNP